MLSKGGSYLLRFATCRLRFLLRIGYVSCYVSATFPATYQLRVGYKAAGPDTFWHQGMRLAHVRSGDDGRARTASCQITPGEPGRAADRQAFAAWFKRRSQLRGGWGRRPKGDAPRSESGALGARWLSPARPQPPRSCHPRRSG